MSKEMLRTFQQSSSEGYYHAIEIHFKQFNVSEDQINIKLSPIYFHSQISLAQNKLYLTASLTFSIFNSN